MLIFSLARGHKKFYNFGQGQLNEFNVNNVLLTYMKVQNRKFILLRSLFALLPKSFLELLIGFLGGEELEQLDVGVFAVDSQDGVLRIRPERYYSTPSCPEDGACFCACYWRLAHKRASNIV